MIRRIGPWLRLGLCLGGFSASVGCVAQPVGDTGTGAAPPVGTPSRYRSAEFQFTFDYPPDWTIASQGVASLTLVPDGLQTWQPETPADIPKDPRIIVEMGALIQERLGAADFPAIPDADHLRAWLEQKTVNGQAQDLSDRMINQVQAFEIIERSLPGCTRVVYWRPGDLKRLVRIAAGCESAYPDDFAEIVNSLQQTE